MYSQTRKTKSNNDQEKAFCKRLNVSESQLNKALAWYQSAMQNTQAPKAVH
jgi:hypothetical protein